MARKLYVGNLPYDTSEQDLERLFAGAGTVDNVKLVRDMATGRPRGFGFVEMASDADAAQAISMLNESDFGGRSLAVNEARPKPDAGGPRNGAGGSRRRSEPRW